MENNRILYLCILEELIENSEVKNKWKLRWALSYADNFYKTPEDNETISLFKEIINKIKEEKVSNDPDFLIYFANKIARDQIMKMSFSQKRQVFVAIADFSTQNSIFKRIKKQGKEEHFKKILNYIYRKTQNGGVKESS